MKYEKGWEKLSLQLTMKKQKQKIKKLYSYPNDPFEEIDVIYSQVNVVDPGILILFLADL